MANLYKQRLMLRLITLGVLTICLGILSRGKSDGTLAGTAQSPVQIKAPVLKVKEQIGTPLFISSPRILAWDGREGEIALELVNVSGKPIRVFAIKEEGEAGGAQSSGLLFSNLDLTNSPSLRPNHSQTIYDTFQAISDKEQEITLSVDYAEFSDGTRWGIDSGKSAERSAGQRAAASIVSQRLLKTLSERNSSDLMGAIDASAVDVDPPAGNSVEWNEGFRNGNRAIKEYLKRVQKQGGGRASQAEAAAVG